MNGGKKVDPKRIAELLGLKKVPESFTIEQLNQAEAAARENFASAKADNDFDGASAAAEEIKSIATQRDEAVTAAQTAAEKFAALEAELPEPVASDQPDDAEADDDKADEAEEPAGTPDPVEPEVVVAEPEKVAVAASVPDPVPSPSPTPEIINPVLAATPAPAPEPEATPAPAPRRPVQPPSSPAPAPRQDTTVTLTAAGDVKDHSAGQNMKPEALGPAFVAAAESMLKGKSLGRKTIATLGWSYPEDRTLRHRDSIEANTAKINEVVAAAQEQTSKTLKAIMAADPRDTAQLDELTAEGGLCAPVNVRYEIFTVGTTDRPLRDSYTRFGATRGGIRFNAPPTLRSIRTSTPNGVMVITEEDDTTGSRYPKDCLVVDCGADTEVTVQAIPLCVQTGTWDKLFFPENFQATWGLARVLHSRIAEETLWTRMETLSTAVTGGEGLGAVPDALSALDRALAQYRWRHRISPQTPLRIRTQAWVQDLFRADLARRAPGDSTLAVSNGEIARYFAARNAAVSYALDANTPGGVNGDFQAAGGLNPWPDSVEFNISIDGTFLFLDGPSLDFGTEIRDMDMIRNNDVGAFMETFENLAFVGPEAVHLSLDICPDGTTAGPDSDYAPCTSGS